MDDQNDIPALPVVGPELELQLDDDPTHLPVIGGVGGIRPVRLPGQHPQSYLDRMRRGQSTDLDNEYSDNQ